MTERDRNRRRALPLITQDPAGGDELVVTRLESPSTGVVIEGTFSLGWIGRLAPEQLDFVGLLLRNRNNLQKVANDLGVAYNTARARLDDIVAALGGPPALPRPPARPGANLATLDRLARGEISFDDAQEELRGNG